MSVVVDASVVVKWVLKEDGSDRANALRREDRLLAPSLIFAEVCNALWKSAMRGAVPAHEALAAARPVFYPLEIVPDESLHLPALALAAELKHPVYDCFYLALAEREGAPLVSADKRLVAAAKKAKGIKVRAL